MSEHRCPVCRKPFEPILDPTEWHTDPPQVCSPECKAKRKRRIEQDRLVLAKKAWCPGCHLPIRFVNYSNPLRCANPVEAAVPEGFVTQCLAQLGTMNEPYAHVLWEDPLSTKETP